MKKLFCIILLILPIIVFFTQDMGAYSDDLMGVGVVLGLIILCDLFFHTSISVFVCKVLYFPLYIPLWLIGRRRRKKQNRGGNGAENDIYWFI